MGNSVLLDTSVVIGHLRYANLTKKLSAYEELYLPQQALGELYYGAYKSAMNETP